MGGRGSFEEAKGENWDSGLESSGPWQAGTQVRGRREVGWRDTGSGSSEDFGLTRGPLGGARQEAALFLLGASWALDRVHHSCRAWRLRWSGAKVGRPRREKGPGSASQAERC